MSKKNYQVISKRFRPQKFSDVIGQDPIVTTLKNAIQYERLAHAYLFCGSRGTGKTTLARIFAKALNCKNISSDFEPCNDCSSCREISVGSSLDVLEIDGASNRGIDKIREINQTVGYTSSTGGYKIYIIDEVHMLTTEAFNALLKTLEEPPAKVKFFFATTEPHKVLATILSRCQRFNLSRIALDKIIEKLNHIAAQLELSVEEEAMQMIAKRAEGGMRDAESLLDQIYSFHGKEITVEAVSSILGIMPKECLFTLDQAGHEGRLSVAFEIVNKIFSEGKDLLHFLEMVTEHIRNILLIKVCQGSSILSLSESDKASYQKSASYYSQEQCLQLLEYFSEAQNHIKFASSPRIALETILLSLIRSHRKIPVDVLVRRLVELERSVGTLPADTIQTIPPAILKETPKTNPPTPSPPPPPPPPLPPLPIEKKITPKVHIEPQGRVEPKKTVTIDPTPTAADLSFTPKPAKPTRTLVETKPEPLKKEITEIQEQDLKSQSHYDTLLQFTAVELNGKVEKIQIKKI